MKHIFQMFTDLFSKFMLPAILISMLVITACGGGGSSSDSGSSADPPLPTTGTTDNVTLSDGDDVNKYGFKKLWQGNFNAENQPIKRITTSTETYKDTANECYIYFGNDYAYWFEKEKKDGKWYGFQFPYTYNASTNIVTFGDDTDDPDEDKIIINGSTLMLMDDDGDIEVFEAASSFDETVTMSVDDDDDDDNFDDTLISPTINSLSPTYNSETVTIAYNITVPEGKILNYINVQMWSPTLVTKYGESEMYHDSYSDPLAGQSKSLGEIVDTVSGTTGSGTMTMELPGAENGDWLIYSVWVSCTDDSSYYMTCQHHGDLYNTYYFYGPEDKEKDLNFAAKHFTVAGSSQDITAPVITSATITGTILTIETSKEPATVEIFYVNDNHYAKEDNNNTYIHSAVPDINGQSVTCDLSTNYGTPTAVGNYYIARIVLKDAAGNCSVYYGYDTGVSFWNGQYSGFGFDFTRLNRANGTFLPEVTEIPNLIFTIGTPTIPATPSNLTVGSATVDSLTLTWNPVSGATTYKIYRSATSGGDYTNIGNIFTPSYQDISLLSGTTYYYKVTAVNSIGESSQSSYQSGTTNTSSGGSVPAAPSGLSVGSATANSLTLTWSSVSGATSYNIYRSATSGGTYSYISNSSAASYVDSSLASGTTYYYKVTAVNSVGEGSESSYVSGTTGTASGGQNDAEFLTAFSTAMSNVSTKMVGAPDEDSDPYTTKNTVSGDISGTCVISMVMETSGEVPTGGSTTTYQFNNYNDDGTIFNGTLTMVMDAAQNGSFTGTITATGAYSGIIEYHIILTGGVQSGYYTVNGTNYNLDGTQQ